MKNLSKLILLLVCSFVAVCATAQNVIYDNGKTRVYDNGYVYSEGGFVNIETQIPNSKKTCKGLYSADGKVLLDITEIYYHAGCSYIYVAQGTEFIATIGEDNTSYLYIPSSVKYIHPQILKKITYPLVTYTTNVQSRIVENKAAEEK